MQGEGSSPVKEPAIGDWLRLVIFFVCDVMVMMGQEKSGHMEEGLCSRSC